MPRNGSKIRFDFDAAKDTFVLRIYNQFVIKNIGKYPKIVWYINKTDLSLQRI